MKQKLKIGFYRLRTVANVVWKINVLKYFNNKFSIQITTVKDALSSVNWPIDFGMEYIVNVRKGILYFLYIVHVSKSVD